MLRRAFASLAATLLTPMAGAQVQTLEPSEGSDPYPVVLTPTRLRQALQDVPASVTIITADTISRFGIMNIPDALRLVPGMEITQPSGNDYRINYHGTNILTPRRMNVLVDGVSVYQPAFARVDWRNLPVAIDDVARIEVTRGPDSAAYGPNSMLAIINIITKHPDDVERVMLSTTVGSNGTHAATARLAAVVGPTSLRLTANTDHDEGYDAVSRTGPAHDGTALNRLNLRSQTVLDAVTNLDIDAGYVRGTKEVPFVETYQASNPDQKVEDFYISGTLRRQLSPTHELQLRTTAWSNRVRQGWTSCPPTALALPEMFDLWRANPAYVQALIQGQKPSGGTAADDVLAARAALAIARLGPRATQPVCGGVNQDLNERRFDIELQDTYVVSEQLRAVGGIGARRQTGSSETFLNGSQSNSLWWGFLNAEYKPSTWLSLNAGAYSEHDQLTSTTHTSPRVAANIKLSTTQALRFVWSTGSRTPDIQEQRADWSYRYTNASPPIENSTEGRFYQSAMSPGGLQNERITSREIGYLVSVPRLGLLLDTKVFDDRLTNLISEKLQVSDFAPTNNGSVHLRGLELQADVELATDWHGLARYAYLDNRNANPITERTQYSRHSGSVGLSHKFGDGWSWSAMYQGASPNGIDQSHDGREELTLSKVFKLAGSDATASLLLRRLDNKTTTAYLDTDSSTSSSYNNRLQIFGHFRVSF